MATNMANISASYARYKEDLIKRYWQYKNEVFPGREALFEEGHEPPVFKAWEDNIIVDLRDAGNKRDAITALIGGDKPHRWARSMSSSQALALSLFGNLAVLSELDCLADLTGESGEPLFSGPDKQMGKIEFEREIDYLREPRKTSIDVFFGGPYQIAVECKLSEREIGPCSRPRLRPAEPNYEADYCSGVYEKQLNRKSRCSLSERGILYWRHIPMFFGSEKWSVDQDHNPCPLNKTYQLVRNILTAGLRPADSAGQGKDVKRTDGHCVLICDGRNPEFQPGGKGLASYDAVKAGLRDPRLLQKCTWQRIIEEMAKVRRLGWVVGELRKKYGL